MTMSAKFPGTCKVCGQRFAAGAKIEWSRDAGSRHADCKAAPTAGHPAVEKMAASDPKARILGNTYPVREELRAMGGEWDVATKSWLVPAAREPEAKALVQAAGPVQVRSTGDRIRPGLPGSRKWRPCGYPGCNPSYCDECDGEGYRHGH